MSHSLLGFVLVRVLQRLCQLTLSRLFLFTGRSGLGCGLPLARLLNYDVVLNVELIVHVHDVDFHALSTLLPLGVVCLLLRPAIYICGNNSLNVKKLLVVSGYRALFAKSVTVRVWLALNILSLVRPAHSTAHTSTPAHRLLRRSVVT